MRCPKCQYISFDSSERCRNCGYEFSLTADAAAPSICRFRPATNRSARSRFRARSDSRPEPARPTRRARCRSGRRRRRDRSPAHSICRSSRSARIPMIPPRVVTPAPRRDRRWRFGVRPRCRRGPASPVRGTGTRSRADEPPARRTVRRRAVTTAAEPTSTVPTAESLSPRRVARSCSPRWSMTFCCSTIGSIVLYLTLKICGLPLSQAGCDSAGSIHRLSSAACRRLLHALHRRGRTDDRQDGGRDTGRPMDEGIRACAARPFGGARAGIRRYRSFRPDSAWCLRSSGAEQRAVHDRLADTRVVKA